MITYTLIKHRNENRILLQFPYDQQKINRLKANTDAKWSNTYKGWHIEDNAINRAKCKLPLASNTTAVSNNSNNLPPKYDNNKQYQNKKISATTSHTTNSAIAACNSNVLAAVQQHLTLLGYSLNTQRTYLGELRIFLQHIKNRNAQTLTTANIKAYIQYCIEKLQLTENTVHSRLNALKFYYEQVLGNAKIFVDVPRPKKHLQLPKVISEATILRGILKIENIKHKAMIMVAYSAGLRVSEVIHLKVTDILSQRMQILVEKSKGKKDRMVPLAKATLQILRQYFKAYKPTYWLFEGQNKAEAYSTRSAQKVFKEAFQHMGLHHKIGFHSLRHSFATHLLENGTDISYIQKLLGHNDIQTTLIYAQVSNKELKHIESPLDKIWRKAQEESGTYNNDAI